LILAVLIARVFVHPKIIIGTHCTAGELALEDAAQMDYLAAVMKYVFKGIL
jgi:hypothetical protein